MSGSGRREEGGAVAGGMTRCHETVARGRRRGRGRRRENGVPRTSLRFLPVFFPFLPPPLPPSAPRHRHPMAPSRRPLGAVSNCAGCELQPRHPANFWTLIWPPPGFVIARGADTRREVSIAQGATRRFRNHGGEFQPPGDVLRFLPDPLDTPAPARSPRTRRFNFFSSELTLTTSLSSPLSRRALSTPTGDWSPSGSSARTLRVSAYRCCGPTPAAGTTPRCAR